MRLGSNGPLWVWGTTRTGPPDWNRISSEIVLSKVSRACSGCSTIAIAEPCRGGDFGRGLIGDAGERLDLIGDARVARLGLEHRERGIGPFQRALALHSNTAATAAPPSMASPTLLAS